MKHLLFVTRFIYSILNSHTKKYPVQNSATKFITLTKTAHNHWCDSKNHLKNGDQIESR